MRDGSADILSHADELGPLVRSYGYRGCGGDYDPERPGQERSARAVLMVASLVAFGGLLNLAKKSGVWDPRPPEVWAALAAWVAIVFILTSLMIRRDARAVLLSLHEGGFRYRGVPIRFDEIRAIRFGRPPSFWESILVPANRTFGRLERANALAAESLSSYQGGSLRVELNNGEQRILNGFRVMVRPEVAGRFFDLLEMRRPGIVRWSERSD